ncbi:MAG: alpha/beta hydrolase, partial [Chthoniobacteraceae bacterium]|nr:alpha/beta hydrolase [Chthoniobacteraceae bacterium]
DPNAPRLALQIFRLLKDALREPPRLWSSWLFDFGRAGLGLALGTVRHMFKDRIEKVLPLIPAPTLIIRGENDPTMPMRWAQEAAELTPNSRFISIPGEAHCVHYSAPKTVTVEVLAHARTSSRG